jgi:hypothetical protein
MWREAMMELLDLLEAESQEDPSLAPRVRGGGGGRGTARRGGATNGGALSTHTTPKNNQTN